MIEKWLKRLTRIELVLIYLVVIAGSIVRMTGSGMGCPDWPKCFGYLIPPTERSQIEWKEDHAYKKGQIIIVDESLRVAQNDFTSEGSYNNNNWAAYTKHDYATFNSFHTWTEYINRLFGALAGIPMLLLVFFSLIHIQKNWRYFVLSIMGLFLLGFEAWLGKLVVDGNLIPNSITIHMMGALAIVAVLLIQNSLGSCRLISKSGATTLFKSLLIASVIMTLAQIILGTQVREQVDVLQKTGLTRSAWIADLDWAFYVHRSFSVLVLTLNLWLWNYNRKNRMSLTEFNWVMVIIVAEVLLGMVLSYFNMPRWAQPSHLLLGTLLFTFQFYALLLASKKSLFSSQSA